MYISRVFCCFLSALLIVSACGCSNGPVTPALDDPVPETATCESQCSHHCLGLYLLAIDCHAAEVEVVPVRTAELHVNVTGILNTTLGVKAKSVPSESDPSNGLFTFDVTLKHPFPTKPQLSGFDVKGILITPGSLSFSSLIFADADETRLENADGYARWWNPTEFTQPGMFGYTQGQLSKSPAGSLTATVNPYKYFADALSATGDLNPLHSTPLNADKGRGVFRAGSENTRRYRIRFPMNPGPQVVYGYAVDASWAAPNPNPPAQIPDDFPIQANQPEAYDIELTADVNTLYFDAESGMKGGVLRLSASVYDWQGRAAGNFLDQVSSFRALAPDLMPGAVPFSFSGQTPVAAQYHLDLTGTAVPAKSGKSLVCAIAKSAGGVSYSQGLSYPAPSDTVAACEVVTVEVQDPECSPDSNNSMSEAVSLEPQEQISDTMCDGTDDTDWYSVEIPEGFSIHGAVRWYCNALSADFKLFKQGGIQIASSTSPAPNFYVIDFDSLILNPGKYFIRLKVNQFSSSGAGALVYLLEADYNLVNTAPVNPKNVTPGYLDCDVTWVKSDGGYIFASGPTGFRAFDIDQFYQLEFLSRLEKPCHTEPAVCFPYMYFWENYSDNPVGIDMIDWTNTKAPVLKENVLIIPQMVTEMVMDARCLYTAEDHSGTWKIGIYEYSGHPQVPKLVTYVDLGNYKPLALSIYDPQGPNTTLVITFLNSVIALNVEDPANPYFSSGIANYLAYKNVTCAVSGSYIPLLMLTSTDEPLFDLLSYSPVTGFDVHGNIPLPDSSQFLTASGSTAYVGSSSKGIITIDYQNPSAPVQTDTKKLFSEAGYVDASPGLLLAIDKYFGFDVFELSIPTNPVMVERTDCVNYPLRGAFAANYAAFMEYVGSKGYLTCLNILNPEKPRVAYRLGIIGSSFILESYGGVLALASAPQNGAALFLAGETLTEAHILYSKTFATPVTAVAFTDIRCYLALTNAFIVLDTSALPAVNEIGAVPAAGNVYHLVSTGTNLYGYFGSAIKVFSLSNPDAPAYIGSVPLGYPVRELAVRGDHLYALTSDTLAVLDISNGDSPVLTGSVTLPHAPDMAFMAFEENYAYVSDLDHPTQAVSVWPADSPTVVGELPNFAPGFKKNGLMIRDGVLYELYNSAGIRMIDLY